MMKPGFLYAVGFTFDTYPKNEISLPAPWLKDSPESIRKEPDAPPPSSKLASESIISAPLRDRD